MAQQTINIGTVANDGTGDPLRTAFDKVNDNFTELYADDAGDVNSVNAGTGISVDQTTGAVTVTNSAPNATHTGEVTGSGALTIASNVITPAKIAASYKDYQNISSPSSTETLDFSVYNMFNITNDIALTLEYSNVTAGDVKTFLITAGASGTSSLSFGSSADGRLVGTGEYDPTAGVVNFLQVVMVTASTAYLSITQSPSVI
jgi:hypothetical protein